jgi:hypothetical protein
MLIDKGLSHGDIVTLKLQSGEELIARYIEDTAVHVRVSQPYVLASSGNGIGLVPYLFTVDPEREIKIYKPIVVMEPSSSTATNDYIRATTKLAL